MRHLVSAVFDMNTWLSVKKKHIFRTFNVKTLTNSSEEIKVKDVMLCLCTILSLTAKTFLSAVKYSFILSINLLPEFVKPKEVLPWVQCAACNDEFEAGQSEKYLTKTGKLRRKSLYHPSHTPPCPPPALCVATHPNKITFLSSFLPYFHSSFSKL